MRSLIAEMRATAETCHEKAFKEGLLAACDDVQRASVWLMQKGMADPEEAAAVATEYLKLVSLTLLAFMWVKMIQYEGSGNISLGLYFIHHILPDTRACLDRILCGKSYIDGVDDADF